MNESSEEPLNAIVQTTAARRGPGAASGGFAVMSGTDACSAATAALLVGPRRCRHSHRQQLGRREAEQQKDMDATRVTTGATRRQTDATRGQLIGERL